MAQNVYPTNIWDGRGFQQVSTNAQTGQILTDNAAQTTALLRALNPAPVPAYVVPNPIGCNCGNNCGCGNNGFYN